MLTTARSASQAVTLKDRYLEVRSRMLELVKGLSAEDLSAQSMPDASPAKWHLGHTSWFFEAMILSRETGYVVVNKNFQQIFNSYYEALGQRVARCERGLMTRPSLDEVFIYRQIIDDRMVARLDRPLNKAEKYLLELGLNHEQQHQELLVQDLIHLMSRNPLFPKLWAKEPRTASLQKPLKNVVKLDRGLVTIGSDITDGFAFDNEMPRHRHWLETCHIDSDLVTNGDWLAFIEDGGYGRAQLWLSDGWAFIRQECVNAPLYWRQTPHGEWKQFTGQGLIDLNAEHPVRHISYYEADAFSRWRGARLPTEAEWETAAQNKSDQFSNLDTEVWQWTASPYTSYPGFRPTEGTASEYNGKFMANQMVLRGGSYATPRDHVRIGYRNFYYPHQRWAPTGLRLAYDSVRTEQMDDGGFEADFVAGLSASPKTASPKWLYDAEGSKLFEDITRLEEYYPTRQEASLLRRIAPEWASLFNDGAVLVEFGSGASEKTRIVLDAAPDLAAYVALDISEAALEQAAASLNEDYPNLDVVPVVADFENLPPLPSSLGDGPKIGFFPGSTIGNLSDDQAKSFLRGAHKMLGEGAYFILGVDLIKDESILVQAYDDAKGVTAQFNKNLLLRANSELGADFDLDSFEHRAVWNAENARMEMHLVATRPMAATIGSVVFRFTTGETIHTESSRKFNEDRLRDLVQGTGWSIEKIAASDAPSVALALLQG